MSMPEQPRRTRAFALTNSPTPPPGYDGVTPAERISMHSLIQSAVDVRAVAGIPEEWQAVLRWCTGTGMAVAEISARLRMKLTPTVAMLTELWAHGLVTHQASATTEQTGDVAFLWRIRNNLAEKL